MSDDEVRPWSEVAVRATAKALPYVGDSALMIVDQVLARRRASGAAIMSGIAAASGGDEALAQRLTIPEVEALFIEGFESALRTGIEAKRRLLALVISNAVRDDALIEPSQLYVMALRDLEAPHIRALARLARVVRELEPQMPAEVAQRPDFVRRANNEVSAAWDSEPAPVQAALIRTGCVQLHRGWLQSSYEIDRHVTAFGLELLDDIERHGGVERH